MGSGALINSAGARANEKSLPGLNEMLLKAKESEGGGGG